MHYKITSEYYISGVHLIFIANIHVLGYLSLNVTNVLLQKLEEHDSPLIRIHPEL